MTRSNLIKSLKALIALLIFSALFYSCAQMGKIDGGEEDEDPPVMVRSRPKNYSANFNGKKVKMKFNEFFTLDNVETKFLMSPPHQEKAPKIKVKGKKIVTKFKEPLRPDTTYTLQYFDCMKDFHEGNQLDNLDFVFSTGAVVDSFAVSGKVFDAENLKKEENILVGLYNENVFNEDSAVYKYKPNYITRTDTAGHFEVRNINKGKYKIFALKDINETHKFDLENEKIAFINSIFEPEAETLTKIDSLPAGTILHEGSAKHKIIDTLLNDTVIIQNILYTTPNNINLYAFNEIKLTQYINECVRDIRTRFIVSFNKSVENDTVIFTYVDDTLKSPNIYYDYNFDRDSLVVWLRDTVDSNNDTLQLRISYPSLDSLYNPIIEIDTLKLKYTIKKAKTKNGKKEAAPKTAKDVDSLNFVLKSNFTGDFDQNGVINLEIPIPIENEDLTKLKVYELKDSSFEDDLNQKLIKAQRLDSAEYRLIFKRGIKGDIIFYPTDSIVDNNWYNADYSQNRDTVLIHVTDSAMIKKGKFKNILKYYNDYYLDQVQKLRDSIPTVIVPQKILSCTRPSRDSILLLFEKMPKRDIEFSPINVTINNNSWYRLENNGEIYTMILTDTSALKKDTLALKINTFDRFVYSKKSNKNVEQFYKDTLFPIYKLKIQSVKSTNRINKDSLQIIFNYPLVDNPVLNLIDTLNPKRFDNINVNKNDSSLINQNDTIIPERFVNHNPNWCSFSINDSKDTMIVVFDNETSKFNNLYYSISYNSIDLQENPIITIDTLFTNAPKEIVSDNNNRRRRSDIGLEAKKEEASKLKYNATLRFPIEYEYLKDSVNHRNKLIKFDWQQEKEYLFEIDDSTFTSILNTPNLYYKSNAKIRSDESYGTLSLNLMNTGNIEHYPDIDENLPPFQDIDTARVRKKKPVVIDSVVNYSSISEGQLIVCLCNDKGEILYSKTTTHDEVLTFDYVLPADYYLKIIHDKNLNNIWDTGEYLKKLYPERVVEFGKKQTVKAKWVVDVNWKL
ncbi:MAG: Ig-like domain-containing protein [Bacteroidales bacterium]|nr:Ig-like domain-containing protein [Bacteroidales bacterium]